jgi:hypothetical protein
VRVILAQQGSLILLLYCCDKFTCRWSRTPIEVLSAGIELFRLGPKPAGSFGLQPATSAASMAIISRDPFISMAMMAVVVA